MGTKRYYVAIFTLIGMAVLSRLVPHPPNFTPMTAIAIFSGAFLYPKILGFLLPLLIMGISDFFIGFHTTMWFTYSAYLFIALGSHFFLIRAFNWFRLFGVALSSSLFFFIWTNFGVWLLGDLYPLNWSGLLMCYEAALPFFRNELVATLIYTTALVAGLWAFRKMWKITLPEYVPKMEGGN